MVGFSPTNSAMELDTGVHSNPNATDRATSLENTTSLDRKKIFLEAEEFIAQYGLVDSRDIIARGILLFYYPDDYARVEEEEVIYLGDSEDRHIEVLPIMRTGICYAAGFLSLLVSDPLPEWGGIWAPPAGIARPLHSIASIIFALLGFWLSLVSNRYWGRRQAFRVGALLAFGTSFRSLLRNNWHLFLLCRGLCATSAVVLTSTSLLYIAETSEPSKRGLCIARWFLGTVFIHDFVSICVSLMVDSLIFTIIVMIMLSVLASVILLGLSVPMLESPYWLASSGNMGAAFYSLRSFRHTELVAARDIYKIHDVINNRRTPFDSDSIRMTTVPKLDTIPINHRMTSSLVICVVLMLIRGISSILIAEIRSGPELAPFLNGLDSWVYTLIYSIVMIIRCAIFSTLASALDHLRRRRIIIGLLCGMCICVAIPFAATRSEAQQTVTIIFYICFIILHFVAEAPIALYISEIFPLGYREMGVALTLSVYAGCTTVLERNMDNYDGSSVLFLAVTLLILLPTSILLAYLFMKETKDLSLEYNSLGF